MGVFQKSGTKPASSYSSRSRLIADIIIGKASARWHPWLMFLCAFIDSSFFPLPVSSLFVILLALNPDRYKEFIISAIAGVLTGALAAYTTGFYFWTGTDGELTVITKYITGKLPGLTTEKLSVISDAYSRYGIMMLVGGAFTFLPYGLYAFFSGISGMNILLFIIGTLTGHGLKIMLLSAGTLKLLKPFSRAFGKLRTGIRKYILYYKNPTGLNERSI